MSPPPSEASAVLDTNFIVGYCTKEEGKYEVAAARLTDYAKSGRRLYVPGVAVSEVLYTICRKCEEKGITEKERDDAFAVFIEFSKVLEDAPNGDLSLTERIIAIRSGYGPNRCYDAAFVALAEQLAATGDTRLATFDQRMKNQAAKFAPTVVVDLLSVTGSNLAAQR